MKDFLVNLDDRGFLLLGALVVDMAWLSCRKFVWSQNFNRLASRLPFLKVRKILYTTGFPISGSSTGDLALNNAAMFMAVPVSGGFYALLHPLYALFSCV